MYTAEQLLTEAKELLLKAQKSNIAMAVFIEDVLNRDDNNDLTVDVFSHYTLPNRRSLVTDILLQSNKIISDNSIGAHPIEESDMDPDLVKAIINNIEKDLK